MEASGLASTRLRPPEAGASRPAELGGAAATGFPPRNRRREPPPKSRASRRSASGPCRAPAARAGFDSIAAPGALRRVNRTHGDGTALASNVPSHYIRLMPFSHETAATFGAIKFCAKVPLRCNQAPLVHLHRARHTLKLARTLAPSRARVDRAPPPPCQVSAGEALAWLDAMCTPDQFGRRLRVGLSGFPVGRHRAGGASGRAVARGRSPRGGRLVRRGPLRLLRRRCRRRPMSYLDCTRAAQVRQRGARRPRIIVLRCAGRVENACATRQHRIGTGELWGATRTRLLYRGTLMGTLRGTLRGTIRGTLRDTLRSTLRVIYGVLYGVLYGYSSGTLRVTLEGYLYGVGYLLQRVEPLLERVEPAADLSLELDHRPCSAHACSAVERSNAHRRNNAALQMQQCKAHRNVTTARLQCNRATMRHCNAIVQQCNTTVQ